MKRKDSTYRSFARREFLIGGGVLLAGALTGAARNARAEPVTADPGLIEDLVAANRILAALEIVDGYGHVSVRHDKNPNRYLIARSIAPELVGANDILELDLDSRPVGNGDARMYLERFIHGEIYKARPEVKAVVHNHAAAVIPFGASPVALRPLYHMAGFIGRGVPIFDIRDVAGDTDMLVKTPELGAALARTLGDKPAALMRGHGAVVVGDSLPQVVGRSYYLQMNAKLQAQAMALGGEITYLDAEEAHKTEGFGGYERAWDLWKRKAMGK
ncbi:MAG: class II aldolase/adducin family protein [Betaproteobacteria bacterium]|nr:class II aldolase/adducin family protein [Betaproteobacteria bacterium]